MNLEEFSREFDILYNSIASSASPNIDEYEKSVYLTKAQLEIVKNYFNPLGNKYGIGFEQSSKRSYDLNNLVESHSSQDFLEDTSKGIDKDSKFTFIPGNVFLPIQEAAYSNDENLCGTIKVNWEYIKPIDVEKVIINSSVKMKVIPKTHDEVEDQLDNPFKNPNKDEIWRINFNIGNKTSSNKSIELVSPYELSLYKIRYVRYPKPIILVDLEEEFEDEELTIEGESNATECELHPGIHREILDRAVELATADYRNTNDLQAKMQVNQRNE